MGRPATGSIERRGTDAQGKPIWRVSVTVPSTGERVRKTVHGPRRDAEAMRRRLGSEVDQGGHISPAGMTVCDLLTRWLADYAEVPGNLRPKTAREYRAHVERDILPALGSIPLARLTPLDIQGLYAAGLRDPRPGLKDAAGNTRPLSPATVRRWHIILHRALGHAVKWRLLASNPADAVEPPAARHAEAQALDAAEAGRLLEAARGKTLEVPIALALLAGLRRGEVFGLRWEDVDLDAGILRVRQALDYHAKPPTFGPPKTAKSRRTVALPARLVELLRRHRQEQQGMRLLAGPVWVGHGLVCCRADGSPVLFNVNRDLDVLLRAAKCRRVTFHMLRHSHGSLLALQGVGPKVVAERLGHADASITLRTYTHEYETQDRQAADAMDGLLPG